MTEVFIIMFTFFPKWLNTVMSYFLLAGMLGVGMVGTGYCIWILKAVIGK